MLSSIRTGLKEARPLVDRKVHAVGSLALRATATTIWTAWGTATRVSYGNRHSARSSDRRRRDRSGKLVPGQVGGSLARTVPLHDGVSVKAAAVDRQGEPWAT